MIVWDAYPTAPAEPLPGYGPESGSDPDMMAPPGRVARLQFDPTGGFLVSMPQYQGVVRPGCPAATVWRPDGSRVYDLPSFALDAAPTAAVVGPGGGWAAVGMIDYDGDGPRYTLQLWDATAGRMTTNRRLARQPDDVRLLPDGGLLVAAGGVWRFPPRLAGNGTRLMQAGPAEVVRAAVGDGWLAGASKSRATVWDAAGKQVADREHKKGPQNGPVAFRPHSSVLAVGHGTVVDLWDFQSGAVVTLAGHKRPVWAVGFGPDGGTAYTVASDGAVIAWDADGGTLRQKFDFGTGKLYSAAVSPDGLTLALGGDDGRVTIVDL